VLVDAGHFGREYNSRQGVESFQHNSPFHSWDFFLGPQYSSQNPEHGFLSHTVIFLNHVIFQKEKKSVLHDPQTGRRGREITGR
jgi:hypothetical protein